MRELPILMNGAMVRAVLEGRKTVTRRLVKRQPFVHHWQMFPEYTGQWRECAGLWRFEHRIPHNPNPDIEEWLRPPCQIGDRLWVRETFDWDGDDPNSLNYRATHDPAFDCFITRWRPSIHMPRWASRITLEVTGVRVERLQDITHEQAMAEGAMSWAQEQNSPIKDLPAEDARITFAGLWESTGSNWAANPWVWVVEFRRIEQARKAA